MQRRSIPAAEKGQRQFVNKAVTSADLETAGKLVPAKGLPGGSGIKDDLTKQEGEVEVVTKDEAGEVVEIRKSLFVEFTKANSEDQTVTGVVLQPEEVDAHGDIMSADVIKKAAHTFLAKFNRATRLGLMHKDFTKNFELLESYLAPQSITIGDKVVKEGSWVITVKVKDASIWKQVKDGKLTGFSIGGKAKVRKLAA
jgi:hypothetical protein